MTIKALAEEISKLQVTAFKMAQPSDKAVETRAKWMFYNAYKHDEAFLDDMKTRLNAVGLVSDDALASKATVDWKLVKVSLDRVFDTVFQSDKRNQYLTAAHGELLVQSSARKTKKIMETNNINGKSSKSKINSSKSSKINSTIISKIQE
jgi:arginine/lysine/ornithine decarboxylase